MPKKLRQFSKSKIYHIIIKGIDGNDIFYDDSDKIIFKKQLLDNKIKFNYKIYAYCLMSNHIHLVISVEDNLLSKSIQSLTIRYAHYFNKKYQRTGPFVQNRFNSKSIEDLKYFLDVCRYVHRNPENAGITKTENYKWSSYREYIYKADLVDTEILLHYFDNNLDNFVNFTITSNLSLKEATNSYLENYVEYELINSLNDTDVSAIIIKKFNLSSSSDLPIFFKNKNEDDLKKCIEELKNIKDLDLLFKIDLIVKLLKIKDIF